MEIKFFYFFRFLSVTMCGFGRAFLPILKRHKDTATEGTERKKFIRQSGYQEVDIRGTGEQGV